MFDNKTTPHSSSSYIEIFKFLVQRPMFSKIQSLLGKAPASAQSLLKDQFDHSNLSSNDASQCPFMNKASKANPEEKSKCPVSGKTPAPSTQDSDSEEEKPQGGCPFMSGASTKKKNPNLVLSETGFDEPFVSKFKYYLSENKIDFSMKRGPAPPVSREIFNNYPIYLQHTLFFNGEDYKKVRNLQVCSRFMAYEQLRQKGNKRFNQGRFYQALDFYERAMSLFRWLQHQEPLNQSKVSSQNALCLEQSFDEASEIGSKVNLDIEEERSKMDASNAAFEDLKTKYKEFFITYNDDNTKLFEGEDLNETADIDMRKSLLIQVYLNMCAAYINTHHYSLALQTCEDGLSLSENVSQLYFRKAQAIALNCSSTMQQLEVALECAKKAVEKRAHEKIFSTANANILKMLNLQDAAEAYDACLNLVEERIKEVQKQNQQHYTKVYQRTKEIHQVEQRIIAEGKVPKERNDQPVLYATTEMKILDRMATKYQKVVEFYTEAKNSEQVKLAKNQFQEVLRVKAEIKALFDVELKEEDGQLGGLDSEKIQKRIKYVKTAFSENIYNLGKFNFTMLEWAIKEIIKEERQERQRQEKTEVQENKVSAASQAVQLVKGYSKYVYLLFLIPVLLTMFNMYAL